MHNLKKLKICSMLFLSSLIQHANRTEECFEEQAEQFLNLIWL